MSEQAYSIRCSQSYYLGDKMATVRALTYADDSMAIVVYNREGQELSRRQAASERDAIALYITACQELADQGGTY